MKKEFREKIQTSLEEHLCVLPKGKLPNELWFQIFRWKIIFQYSDKHKLKEKRKRWRRLKFKIYKLLFLDIHIHIVKRETNTADNGDKVEICRWGRVFGTYMHTVILRNDIVEQQLFSKPFSLYEMYPPGFFTPVLKCYDFI